MGAGSCCDAEGVGGARPSPSAAAVRAPRARSGDRGRCLHLCVPIGQGRRPLVPECAAGEPTWVWMTIGAHCRHLHAAGASLAGASDKAMSAYSSGSSWVCTCMLCCSECASASSSSGRQCPGQHCAASSPCGIEEVTGSLGQAGRHARSQVTWNWVHLGLALIQTGGAQQSMVHCRGSLSGPTPKQPTPNQPERSTRRCCSSVPRPDWTAVVIWDIGPEWTTLTICDLGPDRTAVILWDLGPDWTAIIV
jgi:hypothetical protein